MEGSEFLEESATLNYALGQTQLLPETLELLTAHFKSLGSKLHTDNQTPFYVDLNAVDTKGNSILHLAVERKKRLEFLQQLINFGESQVTVDSSSLRPHQSRLDALKQNDEGNTFFHLFPRYYSTEQYHEFIEFLVNSGLRNIFHVSNKIGATPLHCALGKLDLLPKTLNFLAGRCTSKGLRLQTRRRHPSYVNLNAADRNGNSIIHWAVEGKRNLGFLQHMISLCDDWYNESTSSNDESQRLDIMKQNHDGNTFLHLLHPYYYSADQYHEIVEFVIKKGFGNIFRVANKEGQTPFHLAIYKLELLPKTLDLLVGRLNLKGERVAPENRSHSYIDINAVDKYGDSIFHWAVKGSRSLNFLQHLVNLDENWQNVPIDPRNLQERLEGMRRNHKGDTVLHPLPQYYSADQYHGIAEFLVQMGLGDAFRIKNKQGITPIHMAVYHLELSPKTLDLLSGRGVSQQAGNLKSSSLVCVCQHLNGDGNYGGDAIVAISDVNGDSVLHWALRGKRSLELVEYLISVGGCDWKARNNHNINFVHLSASFGLVDHVRYFVQLGCNVNEVDCNGDNALAYALVDSGENALRKIEFLLSVGVKKDNANRNGQTALMIAMYKGIRDSRILNILR